MIELPIDFIKSGDILGKNYCFKKFSGGMSSTVDLMKGYKLTDKVLRKLVTEYKVQYICIDEPSEGDRVVEFDEGFDEVARQKIISNFHECVSNIETNKVIDIKELQKVVYDIIENVSFSIKNGTGSFRTLSTTFFKVKSHDSYTWEHSVNTSIYAAIVGLSVPEILDESRHPKFPTSFTRPETLVFNMLLHDFGKIRIPLNVLNKDGRLTEKEFSTIQRHPYDGFVYLRKLNEQLQSNHMTPIPAYFMRGCLLHHQAYDGTGYPAFKAGNGEIKTMIGEGIPIIGRIAAVADFYDALTSNRPYRLPFHPADALRIILKERNQKLDSGIVEVLTKKIYPFPKGSTVMLSTGELAAVIDHVDRIGFSPVVRPFLRKIRQDGKERIIRLENRDPIKITSDSKVKIVINKQLYHAPEENNN